MTTRLLLLLAVACGEAQPPRPTNVVDHDLDVPVHREPDAAPVLVVPQPEDGGIPHATTLGSTDDAGAIVTDALAVFENGTRGCTERATHLRPIAERARTLVGAGAAVDDATHDQLASKLAAVEEALDAMAADCRKKKERDPVFEDLRRSLGELFGG
jgi:hypothetical protein